MTMRIDAAVAELAGRQGGVFTRSQAEALGCTRRMIQTRIDAGLWIRMADATYRLVHVPATWSTSLWVATLAPGCLAAISHEAAAAVHGLATFRPGVVVVTVAHAKVRLDHVAVVHQSRRLYEDHIEAHRGLPVTTVARTLIDLAATRPRGRVEIALDDALTSRKTSLDSMRSTFDDLACRGRKGTAAMRNLLAARAPGYTAPASVLEGLFLRLVRRAGLPRPVLQFPHPGPGMEGMRVDAAYPEHRILIELDGRRWHDRSRDHERDRERDVAANLVRYATYRFTHRQVTEQGDWVISVLRRAVAEAA